MRSNDVGRGVRRMNEKIIKDVPYLVHESAMARMERTVSRLWILCILLLLLLFGTNLAWTLYESQFETVETTQTVTQDTDGGGDNNFVGGDLINGAADS